MADLIQLIADDELDVAVSQPELAGLVAEVIGPADPDLRASDSDIAAAILGFEEGAGAVAAVDSLFDESAILAEVVTEDTLAEQTVLLTQDVENGRRVVQDLDALFGEAPPPSAGEPNPGPGGGGVGGGGGTGGPASGGQGGVDAGGVHRL